MTDIAKCHGEDCTLAPTCWRYRAPAVPVGQSWIQGQRSPDGGCIDYVPALADAERQRTEIWTRVMGYHRPLSAFNPGKQAEYLARVPFREPVALELRQERAA